MGRWMSPDWSKSPEAVPYASLKDPQSLNLYSYVTREEDALPVSKVGNDNWDLGPRRNKGSIHSDIWRGSETELARRDYLAIYPVGGWWKEKPDLQCFDRDVRYSLCLHTGICCAGHLYAHRKCY